jgi:exosortase
MTDSRTDMERPPTNGVLEDFRIDFLECWQRLPNKGFFFVLLAGWLALFHFLGSSTLGYVHSPSLFSFMLSAYHPNLAGWLRTLNLNAVGHWLSESEEGHCILAPFVVLGLYWWKRKALMALPLRLWPPGLLVIGAALLLHVFAFLVQQPKLSIVALLTGLYGVMGLAWGPAWLRGGFFPFFLLAFCIPLGSLAQPITFNLRLLVCRLVEFVCNTFLAIDVQRRGTALISPTGHYQYEVEAACSGLRSLIATVGLATVFAFVSFHRWWKRGLLVAVAFPLAVLGNLGRMLAIVIAAEMAGQAAGNRVHEGGPLGVFSLLPYLLAFLGLLLVGHWLRERPPPTPIPPDTKTL